ncbi:hypothetical protein [Gleimia hominis]|uniref:hypothetical protein n=1 Tax=Gleimia hominis TaxID=595468 RepID=UPI000C8006AB|nr:hypothetical protein [Gleimia hominis]WIK65264.1 beta-carotene 15,15'-monooxygenase [Gleimia hominis]
MGKNKWWLAVAASAVAGAVAGGLNWKLRHQPRLARVNHWGQTVSLSEGVAIASATVGAALVHDPALSAATAAVTAAGVWDDVDQGRADGEKQAKGLRGHLAALKSGHVSSGAIKAVAITASAAALALERNTRSRAAGWWIDAGLDTVIMAGNANLLNLFDLRPTRALKVAALQTAIVARPAPAVAATTAAVVLATARSDARAHTMMGDTGANALGFYLGSGLCKIRSRAGRAVLAATIAGLVLLSERVSFTQVINQTPWLRAVDQWGLAQADNSGL